MTQNFGRLLANKVETTDRIGHSLSFNIPPTSFFVKFIAIHSEYKTQTLLNNYLYKIKDIYYNDFWKCPYRRLAPKLYRQLLEFNFGRLLSHNCEFCCFLQSKNGSLATKAKLGKQALACDQCSLI